MSDTKPRCTHCPGMLTWASLYRTITLGPFFLIVGRRTPRATKHVPFHKGMRLGAHTDTEKPISTRNATDYPF